MQNLKMVLTVLTLIAALGRYAHAEVKEYQGPYGLTALVIEHGKDEILAWKLPHQSQKLLFMGTIYDGQDNLNIVENYWVSISSIDRPCFKKPTAEMDSADYSYFSIRIVQAVACCLKN